MSGDTSPAFSPDGARMAFVRQHSIQGGNLYYLDLDENYRAVGEPIALTSGSHFVASPAWTPDAEEIVFFATAETEASFALWRIRPVAGSKPRQLYSLTGRSTVSISQNFSPGEARIADSRQVSDRNIWSFPLRGHAEGTVAAPAVFLASTRDEAQPQFSPDGQTIAFQSARSGFSEVWLCDRDSSNVP